MRGEIPGAADRGGTDAAGGSGNICARCLREYFDKRGARCACGDVWQLHRLNSPSFGERAADRGQIFSFVLCR